MKEHFNRLQLKVSPQPRMGEQARTAILAFFARRNPGLTELDDFMFAIGEALANAIEHSHSSEPIAIECSVDREKIVARISDAGCGILHVPRNPRLPGPFAERGRGLAIMARCTDIFRVDSRPGEGTIVTLGRYTCGADGQSRPA